MSHKQQRRARLVYTPARGQQRSNITAQDHGALQSLVLSNPRLALGLFAQSNIGCLSELGFWERLCRLYPQECARVAQVALDMGIREKPERPPCRVSSRASPK